MNKEEYGKLNSKLYRMIVEAAEFKESDPAEHSYRKQEIAVLVLGTRFIRHLVNSFRRTNKRDEGFFDDLYQEGSLAVVKIIDGFRVSPKLVTEEVPRPPHTVDGRFNLELLDYESRRFRVIPENYNFLWLAYHYAKLRMVRFARRDRSLVEIREEVAPYLAQPDQEAGTDPESLLLAREAEGLAFANLTQVERHTFVARAAGNKLGEIAKGLGLSIEGVRKAEARAVRKVAASMEQRP